MTTGMSESSWVAIRGCAFVFQRQRLYHRHIGEWQARNFAHGRIYAVLHGGENYSLCAFSIPTAPRSRAWNRAGRKKHSVWWANWGIVFRWRRQVQISMAVRRELVYDERGGASRRRGQAHAWKRKQLKKARTERRQGRAVAANPLGDPPVLLAAARSSSYAFMWRVVYSFYGIELSAVAFYFRFCSSNYRKCSRKVPPKYTFNVWQSNFLCI